MGRQELLENSHSKTSKYWISVSYKHLKLVSRSYSNRNIPLSSGYIQKFQQQKYSRFHQPQLDLYCKIFQQVKLFVVFPQNIYLTDTFNLRPPTIFFLSHNIKLDITKAISVSLVKYNCLYKLEIVAKWNYVVESVEA